MQHQPPRINKKFNFYSQRDIFLEGMDYNVVTNEQQSREEENQNGKQPARPTAGCFPVQCCINITVMSA